MVLGEALENHDPLISSVGAGIICYDSLCPREGITVNENGGNTRDDHVEGHYVTIQNESGVVIYSSIPGKSVK